MTNSYLDVSYAVTEVSATFSVILYLAKYPHHCNSAAATSAESVSSQEVGLKPPLVTVFPLPTTYLGLLYDLL